MNRTLTFTSAIVATALSLAAFPAAGQDRRESGHQRGGGHSTASQPAPRQETARHASNAAPQAVPRTHENRPPTAPQTAPRAYDSRPDQAQPRALPRQYDRPSYQVPTYRYDNRRGYAARGYYGNTVRPHVVRPFFSRQYVRPFGWVPYHSYRFSRPYYSFSPWLSLGFGLWIGNPVAYPWGYLGDYQPRVFGDYPEGAYEVTVDSATYGGASFDIQPADADLFVDGEYVGTVGDFGPNAEPLTLAPGPHRIAIQRDGFRPMEWDLTVEPGQVIPYRGVLERQ